MTAKCGDHGRLIRFGWGSEALIIWLPTPPCWDSCLTFRVVGLSQT